MALTVADLKAMAATSVLDIARELAPGGYVSGRNYFAKCPWRADRRVGSFAVQIRDAAAGRWKDFADDTAGDLIDLIAEAKYGGRSKPQRGAAIQWLKARLGVVSEAPAEVHAAREQARKRREADEAREADEQARKTRRAFELWLSGSPLGGTLGETYLRARGIEGAAIPNLSKTFKFLARLRYWKGGAAEHFGPAIVGRYRREDGESCAIHGTWLTEDGRGKADLDPPKLSLGEYKGAFLAINKGASGLEVWEPGCPPGPVQVTEGPEDGWTVAQARPDLRTWAAGSLSNIGNLPRPRAVNAFLVVRQNDWQTPAAVSAFERALEALARHGAPVVPIAVGHGKDPNDQLRGKA